MAQHRLVDPSFKGFMADSAMANWNAMRIVYSSGKPDEMMENREKTCLLHLSTSLHKHIQKHIKKAFQNQQIMLYKQHKSSKTLDEAKFNTLQFGHGDCHLVQPAKKRSITWTIGLHSGIFGTYSGKAS